LKIIGGINLLIVKGERVAPFDRERLKTFVQSVNDHNLPIDSLVEKLALKIEARPDFSAEKVTQELLLAVMERIGKPEGENHPDYTYMASNIFLRQLYKQVEKVRGNLDFYNLIRTLVGKGVYHEGLMESYSVQEIHELAEHIDFGKDRLFSYIGIKTLADRYLAKDFDGTTYELPQERWMIIAMWLMKDEFRGQRSHLVLEAYWALSNLYMTVATPTLANAGKKTGQLSSCFIDTVDDSLRGIYDSNTDGATVSKYGGGLGVYLGKIRAMNSSIQNYKGKSSGVIPWMKQLNNTAVSVDQLGQRNGAIAVYLDVWHKDIIRFLEVKLNNGDERLRTHDLFTGLCIPDLFMEQVEKRGVWNLFDPHEVRQVMGYSLEDFYDEEKGKGSFRSKYMECVNNPELSRTEIPAIDIMKAIMKSQLEAGMPFMFYRDTVNRANPNSHKGLIYASNLCTEIMQNMSPTIVKSELVEIVDGEPEIVTRKTPGDFVVCNLSSISLAKVVRDGVLQRLVPIQVRMLDNVIDLNTLPVPQAKITNNRYRAIGAGTYGWHHLLAQEGIAWESPKAVEYCDNLYEEISYLMIQASMNLASEKGAYPYFEGSDWGTGEYFVKRGYVNDRSYLEKSLEEQTRWEALAEDVSIYGMRNGYLMAVAPNASTAIIANSTASIDPIFKKEYSEEKKNYKIPVTAPDLSAKNWFLYKTAYEIDQHASIAQNAVRQRHVDQAISFNFYVKNSIKAKELLALHMDAWESGLKTTYYTRSQSAKEAEECESCT
jgi:ribonucleoside-diphosphate reductase alpha chain